VSPSTKDALPNAAPAEGDLHQIGDAAERVGLSLRTVRYYEEVGLVVPEKRSAGGFRLYGEEQIERLRLITQMKPLKFSIEQMGDVLDALDDLHAADTSLPKRGAATERLAELARYAEERCAKMRRQLLGGEELVEQLVRESGSIDTPTGRR
jgi:MerR family transcriptional regulator, copper efflux regulator